MMRRHTAGILHKVQATVQFVALFLDLNNPSVLGGAACPTGSQAKHWILSYSTSLWTRLSCGGAAVMRVWSTSGGLKVGAHCNSEVKILGLISVTFRTADTTDSTNTTILGFQNRAAVASSSGILWNRETPRWLMTQAHCRAGFTLIRVPVFKPAVWTDGLLYWQLWPLITHLLSQTRMFLVFPVKKRWNILNWDKMFGLIRMNRTSISFGFRTRGGDPTTHRQRTD